MLRCSERFTTVAPKMGWWLGAKEGKGGARRFGAAWGVGLMAVMAGQGCSLFTSRAPRVSERNASVPEPCNSSEVWPVLDSLGFGYQVARVVVAANGPEQVEGAPFDKDTDILFGAAFGALFLSSAVYGFQGVSECRQYKEWLREEGGRVTHRETPSSDSGRARNDESDETEEEATPPKGGAGFEFGQSVAAAAARCADYPGQWSQHPGGYECASVQGTRAIRVGLQFCAPSPLEPGPPSLCRVEMRASPLTHDGAVWARLVAELGSELRKRLGVPENRINNYPQACRTPEAFYQCLVEGRVRYRLEWHWNAGHRVDLNVEPPDAQGQPSVSVTFSNSVFRDRPPSVFVLPDAGNPQVPTQPEAPSGEPPSSPRPENGESPSVPGPSAPPTGGDDVPSNQSPPSTSF